MTSLEIRAFGWLVYAIGGSQFLHKDKQQGAFYFPTMACGTFETTSNSANHYCHYILWLHLFGYFHVISLIFTIKHHIRQFVLIQPSLIRITNPFCNYSVFLYLIFKLRPPWNHHCFYTLFWIFIFFFL